MNTIDQRLGCGGHMKNNLQQKSVVVNTLDMLEYNAWIVLEEKKKQLDAT